MRKKEGFAESVIFLMMSQGIIKIFGLLYSMYLINKTGFGDKGNAIYMSGYQVFVLFLTLSSASVPNSVAKLVSEKIAIDDYNGANRVFKISLLCFGGIGITETIILFFCSKWISNSFLLIPECEYGLIALSPAIFLSSVLSVIRGYFNGVGIISKTAKSQTIEQIFKSILTIVFVELIFIKNNDTVAMASIANFGTTCSIFISLIYMIKCYIYYRKFQKIEFLKTSYYKESNLNLVRRIFSTSIPIMISAIIGSLNKNIDSITVVRILTPILGENVAKLKYGILSSKIDMLTLMPLSFNIAFSTVLIPEVSAGVARNDIDSINNKLSFSLLVTTLIAFPASLGISLYSNQILNLLFPNSSSGGEVLKISAFCIIFMAFTQTIGGVLHGIGKTNTLVWSSVVGLFVKFILNIILLPISNIYEKGAVIANLFSSIVIFVIVWSVLRKNLDLKFNLFIISIKPMIATIIMGFSSYIIYTILINVGVGINVSTIIGILLAVFIYVISIIILRVFNKNQLILLPNGEKIYKFLKKIKFFKETTKNQKA